MKNYLKAIALALFFVSPMALSAPFLMSDPYPANAIQPDTFTVVIDGNSKTVSPTKNADNLNVLKFNLAGINPGNKSAVISATNIWGSASTTFNFAAGAPVAPTGFYLSNQ